MFAWATPLRECGSWSAIVEEKSCWDLPWRCCFSGRWACSEAPAAQAWERSTGIQWEGLRRGLGAALTSLSLSTWWGPNSLVLKALIYCQIALSLEVCLSLVIFRGLARDQTCTPEVVITGTLKKLSPNHASNPVLGRDAGVTSLCLSGPFGQEKHQGKEEQSDLTRHHFHCSWNFENSFPILICCHKHILIYA